MCGNITGGVKIILPGGSEPLPLFWGMQAPIFDVKPPPRTEYKLMLYYALEPADAGGKPQPRTVESAPFRLELSKRKKRASGRYTLGWNRRSIETSQNLGACNARVTKLAELLPIQDLVNVYLGGNGILQLLG